MFSQETASTDGPPTAREASPGEELRALLHARLTMSSESPKIVITGIGSVSPFGIGIDAQAEGLQNLQNVVRANATPGLSPLSFDSYSIIEGFEPKKLVKPRKSIKLMCREILTGVAAAQLAVDHASLDTTSINLERFGVVLGSEMMYGDPLELTELFASATQSGDFSIRRFGERLSQDLFPLWMLKYLPNMPACHIGIAHNSQGPNNSIVQGDASSLLAIAESVSLIRRGWADVMIAGGSGTIIQPARAANLSPEVFTPSTTCRPFDASRDGTVPGEGAATFVLETAEHAAARGAKPLAEVAGFGRTFELARPYSAFEPNSPSQSAIQRSITAALSDAQTSIDRIDHVNAHATGSKEFDAIEARAIAAELPNVPVTAIKSYFGNLGAGSGAIEMAASVLAFEEGSIAPTLNFETADPDCPVNVIAGNAKPVEKSDALILSQSSTGQAA
ncbi:MAG: beta-ketoacyl-[acyl-carrier-protein] synthase family protein, partial [Planctomycetota bacterium]